MKLSVAFISIVALAATAHADNKDKADSLFKQGKKLMGEKRYADACESFEKSFKLDPVIGTQLNIA
jgi:outer membrane protein assembly factor BamD (BamD/ComL family)